MDVLLVGAGVIGTVVGAQLAAGGNRVDVLAHGSRTDQIADGGLMARDTVTGAEATGEATVVPTAGGRDYDLILIAVRREQIDSVAPALSEVTGRPTVLFFGNNPGGRAMLTGLPGTVRLGFAGFGGSLVDGVAEYARAGVQATRLELSDDPRMLEFRRCLRRRGFQVHWQRDMEGWLVYHAVLVACIAAVLRRHDDDLARLAADRQTLTLMCQAIHQGVGLLRSQGLRGLPASLAVLAHPLVRPAAVSYCARLFRSQQAELYIEAHARHAPDEMAALGADVLDFLAEAPGTDRLRRVLGFFQADANE